MSFTRPLPWSDSCFVCGDANHAGLDVRFVVDGDLVRVDTVIDGVYEGYPGHVHGGVITALLDETIGWACSVAARRFFYTVELKVRFNRPVPAGLPIVVKGQVQDRSRKLAHGKGWIENGDGTVLATAEGVFFPATRAVHDEIMRRLKMPGRPARLDDV